MQTPQGIFEESEKRENAIFDGFWRFHTDCGASRSNNSRFKMGHTAPQIALQNTFQTPLSDTTQLQPVSKGLLLHIFNPLSALVRVPSAMQHLGPWHVPYLVRHLMHMQLPRSTRRNAGKACAHTCSCPGGHSFMHSHVRVFSTADNKSRVCTLVRSNTVANQTSCVVHRLV